MISAWSKRIRLARRRFLRKKTPDEGFGLSTGVTHDGDDSALFRIAMHPDTQ